MQALKLKVPYELTIVRDGYTVTFRSIKVYHIKDVMCISATSYSPPGMSAELFNKAISSLIEELSRNT